MSRSRLRRWLALTLSLLITSVIVPITPSPAAAAVTCFDTSCNGLWPGEQGCRDDQQAIISFDIDLSDPMTTGFIFYSRACRATWAEFTINITPSFLHVQLWAQPQYGGTEYLPVNSNGGNATGVEGTTNLYRSVMTSWTSSVKGCWSVHPSPSDPTGSNDGDCSVWV